MFGADLSIAGGTHHALLKADEFGTAEDLREYLRAYSAEAYPIDEFRLARCGCASVEFKLEADDNEGVARRTCAKCKKHHFICDSEEFWGDADPTAWKCIECQSAVTNIGVGFSLYDAVEQDVRWVYIGVRCAKCSVLGCFAGWKVGYGPSRELMDQV
jgi:hypothetical protein